MKKIRYTLFLILLVLVFITRFCFKDYYSKIKEFVSKDIHLYNISFLYANTLESTDKESSISDEIVVKNITQDTNKYYIETLDNEIRLPFSGIVTKKNSELIKIEVDYDVIFYIYGIKPSVILYESFSSNQLLGYSDSYTIWSNNDSNLSLLNYKIEYEKV